MKDNILLSGYAGEYIFEYIRKHHHFYEQAMLDKWILPRKDDFAVIYDIGANIGNHTIYFSTKTNAQKIYSFEPMQLNYNALVSNVEKNSLTNVVPMKMALGAAFSQAYMEITKESNFGSAKVVDNPNIENGCETSICPIDELQLPVPDLVKIDVEGYEVEVLRGMKDTLKQADALVWIEVDDKNAELVYDIMYSYGYGICDYNLQSSNNILFYKCEANAAKEKMIFSSLMEEATKRRENWILLGKEMSKFMYEQKELSRVREVLKQEEKKNREIESQVQKQLIDIQTHKYEIEMLRNEKEEARRVIEAYKEEISCLETDLEKKNKEIANLSDQLQTQTSYLICEQRKIKESQKELEQLQNQMETYKQAKLFRLMLWKWKLHSKCKFYVKKRLYAFGHYLYVKLTPYPKVRKICSKINSKLGIFHDTNKVITYHEETQKKTQEKISHNKSLKKIADFNVAMVVDEFTFNSFKYEFNPYPVEPGNWRKIFAENDIDIFFCESAWVGLDNKIRPWRGQVYSSINFKKENRGALLEILDYCKKNNIPTVFWNKEDPTHYSDKVHNFVDTAIKFDHIFTTDKGCVERYKNDYGHNSVHLLMFATQPRLFNPIEKYERTEEIIFAGSWYNQHPRRCEEMGSILDSIVESSYPLKIYDRHSETDDPNHFFPERFQSYINPCLSHDKMEIAYKSSKYALNINTVTDSETMFARRVFELMSSNTLVLSNYSKGMEELFGDNVVFVDGEDAIKIENSEQKRINSLYLVLRQHTYKERFKQILQDINIEYVEEKDDITIVYIVEKFADAEIYYKEYLKIEYPYKKCIFYISSKCNERDLRMVVEKYSGNEIAVYSQAYEEKYDNVLTVDTKYFLLATKTVDARFIERAICHFCYLDRHVGVADKLNRFSFEDRDSASNIIFHNSMFKSVMEFNQENKYRIYLV